MRDVDTTSCYSLFAPMACTRGRGFEQLPQKCDLPPGSIYMFAPVNNPHIGVQMSSVVKPFSHDHHLLMLDVIVNWLGSPERVSKFMGKAPDCRGHESLRTVSRPTALEFSYCLSPGEPVSHYTLS